MERAMSVEERIRKAEDIYNRRNGGQYVKVASKNKKEKTKRKTAKRLLMQIFICLLIYIVFYSVINRNHIFSEEFRNEVNEFFTQKTRIYEFYSNAKSYMSSKFNKSEEVAPPGEETEPDKTQDGEKKEDGAKEETPTENDGQKEKSEEGNIGGSTEEEKNDNAKESSESDNKELSAEEQMKKNAAEIKAKISFITPINGRISSKFGWRNPTTVSVPKYHTGLDIAANEGTVIKSATDGKVILASSQGDYGNHYQIQTQDIVIVYAHCKKLYLKEGDTVKQGQAIAEVGSTGNSTGAHLHFEIRKGDEKIDPQLILDI